MSDIERDESGDPKATPEPTDFSARPASPLSQAVLALADLLAESKSGGTVDADGRAAIREAFVSLTTLALADERPVFIDILTDSFWVEGKPLVGGRVGELAAALRAANLHGLAIEPGADVDELDKLAGLLARDWSRRSVFEEDIGATAVALRLPHVHLDIAGQKSRAPRAVRAGVGPVAEFVDVLEDVFLPPEDLAEQLSSLIARVRAARGASGADEDARLPEELRAELSALRREADVEVDRVGRAVFELLRLDPSGVGAAAAATAVVDLVLSLLGDGHPEHAAAVVRPLIVLTDPDLFPDFAHREVVHAELRRLIGAEAGAAVARGFEGRPVAEAWKGALFTIAQISEPVIDDAHALCFFGAQLPVRALQVPLADVLWLRVAQSPDTLRTMLYEVTGPGAGVVLLAMGRHGDSDVLELLLGQARGADPVAREAALMALRPNQTPRVRALARESISDSARPVRFEALRYLSVYRDAQAAVPILNRLRRADGRSADMEELRALAIAYARVTRGDGVTDLYQVASGELACLQDEAALAAMHGLLACGTDGREALVELAREHPSLGDTVRMVLQ